MKKAKYLIMMGIISAVDIFTDETSYMITNVNSTNVLEANQRRRSPTVGTISAVSSAAGT